MSVKRARVEAERLNADELDHWKRCYRVALKDCFQISTKPICVRLAAETADLSVAEYRKRVTP